MDKHSALDQSTQGSPPVAASLANSPLRARALLVHGARIRIPNRSPYSPSSRVPPERSFGRGFVYSVAPTAVNTTASVVCLEDARACCLLSSAALSHASQQCVGWMLLVIRDFADGRRHQRVATPLMLNLQSPRKADAADESPHKMEPMQQPSPRRGHPSALPCSVPNGQDDRESQSPVVCAPESTTSMSAVCVVPPVPDNKTVLTENDWEELLECAQSLTDYVSPDVIGYLQEYRPYEVSQELDVSGREFLGSPSIPVIGTVPTRIDSVALPKDVLQPIQLPSLLYPYQPLREGLRERRRPPVQYQPFPTPPESLALQPFRNRQRRAAAKSARARLFMSPTDDDQENMPVNLKRRPKHQVIAAVLKPDAKIPARRGRRSLESASPERYPVTSRRAHTARKSKDCSVPGCTKGARSKGLCKRHGGGKRCTYPNCGRSDQGGGYCIAHGGGKRCAATGCRNSAQSRGLCKSHGGGKRCSVDGCEKSSQEGGVCRSHGGGKLCKAATCFNLRHQGGHCRSHA